MTAKALLVLAFLLLLAAPEAAVAGELAEPGTAPAEAQIAAIRRRLDQYAEQHAAALIAEKSTSRESADTALVIGAFMLMGNIGEADPFRALDYFRQASELGCPEADAALANLYNNGLEKGDRHLPRDPEKARSYFQKAADAGLAAALLEMGEIYNDGKNVTPDSKKALEYYMKAAERGDPTALQRLEPVMRSAREWEEARPGRKSNFPTSKEDIVNPELARQAQGRNASLDRLASKTYVELNKRIAASVK